MKEYQFRRMTFYGLRGHEHFEDEHKNFDITFDEATVVQDAVTYLTDGTSYLRFPGAARAVAIAAADIISREFSEDFLTVLNDPNLMNSNDPYYRPYEKEQFVYDEILKTIPREKINWKCERMRITQRLILEEYMLDPEGLKLLDRDGH